MHPPIILWRAKEGKQVCVKCKLRIAIVGLCIGNEQFD